MTVRGLNGQGLRLFVVTATYVVVAAMTWGTGITAGWIAFGISTGIAVLAGTSAVLTRRISRKAGHGLVALAALWSLIASLVFTGTALHWLILANAILVGAFALADLAVHEVTTEKVVRQLAAPATANGRGPAEERIAA
jgi:hypothetical protein